MTDRGLIFSRLFGIALVAHVVGNWAQPDIPNPTGYANLAVGLVGIALTLRPSIRLLIGASGLVVASFVLEMPFTGNHWLLAALVAAAVLVSRGNEPVFQPAVRWILLIFYGFAAFAKLNSGFFDPSVSCAPFYVNQSLNSFGLQSIGLTSPVAIASVWVTVVAELSIPVLLVFRRTRYLGLVLGTSFHTFVSFDLDQHFYDFTAVLLPLFWLFVPDETVSKVAQWVRGIPKRLTDLMNAIWLTAGVLMVFLAALPATNLSLSILERMPFVLWIPFSVSWLAVLLLARAGSQAVSWQVKGAAILIVLLTVLNGLTPYTELKTAYGFNMYANLVTAGGASNHFVIRRTFPLRDGYQEPMEILESSDPGLDLYRDQGYLVAYPQLRQYLAARPDVSVTYRRGNQTVSIARAGDSPEFRDPGPWWWRFFPLRAVDTLSPPRCQDVFLPAL